MKRSWPRRAAFIALGLGLVFGTFAALSAHYRRVGLMAPDEGFYTLAARSVMNGEVPYRDFAYTQMPFLPYVNGFLMSFSGFGLDQHRAVSAVMSGLGLLAVVVALARRLGKWEPALLAGFVVAASPRWTFLSSMGVWAGTTSFFVDWALAAALWPGSRRWRLLLFCVAGTAAVGCRLSAALTVAALFFVFWLEAGSWKERFLSLAVCLVSGVVAFAPFAVGDPGAFYFANWLYHVSSELHHPASQKLQLFWDVSPAAITLLAVSLAAVPALLRGRRRTELVFVVAAVAGLALPMLPGGAWGVYVGAGIPVAAAAGAVALWSEGSFAELKLRFVAWALPAMAFMHHLPFEDEAGATAEVGRAAAFIRSHVEPGPLLTGASIVAVEAGRDVLQGTELGNFSAWPAEEHATAKRYLMTTLGALTRSVEAEEPAAVVRVVFPEVWRMYNFRWAVPKMALQPQALSNDYERAISEHYERAWKEKTLEVLVRKQNVK